MSYPASRRRRGGSGPAPRPEPTPLGAPKTGAGRRPLSLVFGGGRPAGMDRFDALSVHDAEGERISAGGFVASRKASQRVPTFAVHVEHQPAHPLNLHVRLDIPAVFEDLRSSVGRGTKLSLYSLAGHASQAGPRATASGIIDASAKSDTGAFSFRRPGCLRSGEARSFASPPRGGFALSW
jgi:hypothetical protein